MKKLSLLTLVLCSFVSAAVAQYTLTVEASPAVVDYLGTTYRFYIDLEDATDQVSALGGDNRFAFSISAPAGAYNNQLNNSWSASGINPGFIPQFPELVADSYATIGLDGPASSSGINGAADPSYVENEEQPFTPFFTAPSATSVLVDDAIGGYWYVLNTAANAAPQGDDLKS